MGRGGQGTCLGKNKEVFDAEVFAILQAVKTFNAKGDEKQNYTVFSDSQAAIFRVRHDDCGPAQALARAVVDFSYELQQRGNSITIRWTPSHGESKAASELTRWPREQRRVGAAEHLQST